MWLGAGYWWYTFDEFGRCYDIGRAWAASTPPTLEEWQEEGTAERVYANCTCKVMTE